MLICKATVDSPNFLDDGPVLHDVLVPRPEHVPVNEHRMSIEHKTLLLF
jgi:hypothetical protein